MLECCLGGGLGVHDGGILQCGQLAIAHLAGILDRKEIVPRPARVLGAAGAPGGEQHLATLEQLQEVGQADVAQQRVGPHARTDDDQPERGVEHR